jgi:acetylglutamate kinase
VSARVVKIGGSVLSDIGWLALFAEYVAEADDRFVVVHGGGPEINQLAERLGLQTSFVEGRRVTTPEVLDAAQMVLSGRVNKRIVSALLDAGVNAVGLSGVDGALVTARVRDGGALGRVGELTSVNPVPLQALLAIGALPVISPISRGTDGGALNVNADEVATGVARALGAPELLYLTNVPGVRDGEQELRSITASAAASVVARGAATGGMAVKLEAARHALAGGVPLVRIGSLAILTDPEAGTSVRPGAEAMA